MGLERRGKGDEGQGRGVVGDVADVSPGWGGRRDRGETLTSRRAWADVVRRGVRRMGGSPRRPVAGTARARAEDPRGSSAERARAVAWDARSGRRRGRCADRSRSGGSRGRPWSGKGRGDVGAGAAAAPSSEASVAEAERVDTMVVVVVRGSRSARFGWERPNAHKSAVGKGSFWLKNGKRRQSSVGYLAEKRGLRNL